MVINIFFTLLFNFSFIALFFSFCEAFSEDYSSIKKVMRILDRIFLCLAFVCFLCIGSLLIWR